MSPAKLGDIGLRAPGGDGGISAARQAAQEALCRAGQFLKWEELQKLAKTVQAWRISELLVSTVLTSQIWPWASAVPCPVLGTEGCAPTGTRTLPQQILLQAVLAPEVSKGTLQPG